MNYDNLCKQILNVDPKVRFAGICDNSGEIKYGGQREGVKNLLSPEETKRSNLQALARWGLRNVLASKIVLAIHIYGDEKIRLWKRWGDGYGTLYDINGNKSSIYMEVSPFFNSVAII